MATVALLFPVAQSKIDTIVLDATLSENHQAETEVTQHPVEQGANIVDHKRPKPLIVTIDGLITNTPLGADPDPTRVQQVHDQLLLLKDSSSLIKVVTSIKTYENMTVTSVPATRDAKSGQSLRVQVVCQEIKQVTLQVANVEKKSSGRVNLGKKATTKTPPAQQKTAAAGLKDAITGQLKGFFPSVFGGK